MLAFLKVIWHQATAQLHDNQQVRSPWTIAYSLRSVDFVSVILNVEVRYFMTPLSSISTWSNLAASSKLNRGSKLIGHVLWTALFYTEEIPTQKIQPAILFPPHKTVTSNFIPHHINIKGTNIGFIYIQQFSSKKKNQQIHMLHYSASVQVFKYKNRRIGHFLGY